MHENTTPCNSLTLFAARLSETEGRDLTEMRAVIQAMMEE